MRTLEYGFSVALALLVLLGMIAWTQASQPVGKTALSCQPGKAATAVVLKGMSIYPRCPGVAKRS
jgi:hypothetical protein